MNVYDAASTNIAIRDFQPKIISNGELKTILEAARLTQSAKNLQPWYFVVIQNRGTLDEIANLMKGDFDEGFLKKSPMAVAIVGDTRSEFWLFDLGRVAQTMTLVAWDLGIGSCIISGPEPPDREDYRTAAGKIVGIPEGTRLQELIVFGYPKQQVKPKRKNRKKTENIVFTEKFGNRFEGTN